jgi:uncharacterized protein
MHGVPSAFPGRRSDSARCPGPRRCEPRPLHCSVSLAIVIVAAGEEWLYRGYAIERLEAVTGSAWTAGGISLALFAAAHLPLWGWGVALTTLVSGSIFTVLYIRYRDVAFLMLAHVLTDLYGLVIAPLHR